MAKQASEDNEISWDLRRMGRLAFRSEYKPIPPEWANVNESVDWGTGYIEAREKDAKRGKR